MKWNWFVFFGAIAVIVSAVVLPVVSYAQLQPDGGVRQVAMMEPSGVFLAVLILLFMFSSWKLRSMAWTVLGLVGVIWVPNFARMLYEVGKPFLGSLASSGPSVPYAIGLYLILAGFACVVAGGSWEYSTRRRNTQLAGQNS